jgi:hypothetical protein
MLFFASEIRFITPSVWEDNYSLCSRRCPTNRFCQMTVLICPPSISNIDALKWSCVIPLWFTCRCPAKIIAFDGIYLHLQELPLFHTIAQHKLCHFHYPDTNFSIENFRFLWLYFIHKAFQRWLYFIHWAIQLWLYFIHRAFQLWLYFI